MKSLKRRGTRGTRGKKRKSAKRGGAEETKEYPNGTYVGSIDANGNRQSTGQFDAGKMTYNNGDKFEGFWKNDKATGLGIMTYANGDNYRGSWANGKRQGIGKIQYNKEDGRIYNGNWIQDNKQGQGTMAYPDGSKYMGQWIDDKRNGPGAISYKNKDEYHGEWDDDKRKNGNGTMIYSNDDQYQGNFVDDKRNGNGVIVYKNGDQYEGEWLDDMRQGEGLIDYSDGRRYKGNWVQDKIQGEGGMMYPDGSTYVGTWDDDKRNGEGVLFDSNREELYRGNWENDERRPIDANQIHKFTANIDFNELNAFLEEHSLQETPYIEQPTPDDFGVYIKDSMGKIIKSADAAKIEERLKNFEFLMENTLDKIKYSVYSDNLKTGVFLSLKYAQLQSQAFKEAYVESYLDDTCKAQSNSNDISVENLSCPTGTFERFVTSLAVAATAVLSSGQVNEEKKQEYEKLDEMVNRNLKTLIQKLIEEWQYGHRRGENFTNADGTNIVGKEARRADLKAHIEKKVTNDTPETNELIEELIKEFADPIGYDDDEFPQGGGRTRKQRRKGKRSSKKTKKRKLKKRKGGK